MAVPSNPTISDIVTEGLKRGGRTNPSAGDITTCTNRQFQEVKADIYLKAPKHRSLEATLCIPVKPYVSRYDWPVACEDVKSVQLIMSSTEGLWQGQAQAGGSSSITLDASFNQDSAEVTGRMIYLVYGTGAGQFAQISSYDNSTKVATVEAAWATLDPTWVSPGASTGYLIELQRAKIFSFDKPLEWDTIATPYQRVAATHAAMVGRQIWLNTSPDRYYALHVTFWYALDQLDEAGSLFLGHLRKFQNIYLQGIAVKTMQRYDEDRYTSEISIYNTYLDLYGATAGTVGQAQFRDI